VTDRVLFLPNWLVSPRACEKIPGFAAALRELRDSFEVEVFAWPWFHEPRAEAGWRSGVRALRKKLSENDDWWHVVTAPSGTAMMIPALGPSTKVRSFVAGGVSALPATLTALNLLSVSDAASVRLTEASRVRETSWSYQAMRPVTEGATEEERRRLVRAIEADIDNATAIQILDSFSDLNLLREADEITVPMLYLSPTLALPGIAEIGEAIVLLAPRAEIEEIEIWPGRLHEPASGEELAGKAIAFVGRHNT
jgi:hypothetical protein